MSCKKNYSSPDCIPQYIKKDSNKQSKVWPSSRSRQSKREKDKKESNVNNLTKASICRSSLFSEKTGLNSKTQWLENTQSSTSEWTTSWHSSKSNRKKSIPTKKWKNFWLTGKKYFSTISDFHINLILGTPMNSNNQKKVQTASSPLSGSAQHKARKLPHLSFSSQ